MIAPTDKSKQMQRLLETFKVNREESILNEVCVNKPVGCGEPVTKFDDEVSSKEYMISGLCQSCQDKMWEGVDDVKDAARQGS